MAVEPATGRAKIANAVLEEMRRYLLADTGESHEVKVDKVRRSVEEAEKDTMVQKCMLSLEAPPKFTNDLKRGKGIVFDYEENVGDSSQLSVQSYPPKLMADSFKAQKALSIFSAPGRLLLCEEESSMAVSKPVSNELPTVFKANSFAPCSSGNFKKRNVVRKRPPKSVRQQRYREVKAVQLEESAGQREGKQIQISKKRKCAHEEVEEKTNTKAVCLKAIPNKGFPPSQ